VPSIPNPNAFAELRWVLRDCQDVALQPKCRSAGVLSLSTAPTLVRSFLLAPGADASPASPSLVSLATSTALRWFGTALSRNCNCAINAAGQDRVQCHWCQSGVKLHTILVQHEQSTLRLRTDHLLEAHVTFKG